MPISGLNISTPIHVNATDVAKSFAVCSSSCVCHPKLYDHACLPIARWFTTIKPLCTHTLLLTVLARHFSCRQSMLWHGRSYLSRYSVSAGRRASGKRADSHHAAELRASQQQQKTICTTPHNSMKEGCDWQHMRQIVAEASS
jgi:hypothetical protein